MARPISAETKEDLKEMDLLPHIHIMADLSRGKVRKTVNPKNGGTICPILLTGQKICQPPIKHSSLSTHTSSGSKLQGSKWGQLYFSNSVTIATPFSS